MMETSIEITNDGKIYCDRIKEDSVNGFLMLFAMYAQEDDYNYIKMNEGMVQPQKKNIVISFGIELYPTEFFVKNVLSSMDFEVTKKFIADIYNL